MCVAGSGDVGDNWFGVNNLEWKEDKRVCNGVYRR